MRAFFHVCMRVDLCLRMCGYKFKCIHVRVFARVPNLGVYSRVCVCAEMLHLIFPRKERFA